MHTKFSLSSFAALLLLALPALAEVQYTEKAWTPEEFKTMDSDVTQKHDLNFLNFFGSEIKESTGIGSGAYLFLFDGMVGTFGDDGRAFIEGNPAKMYIYLGRPRNIKEFAIYTGNIDTRVNQRYEVRFANNSAEPGVKPQNFPEDGKLSTGSKVVGNDRGGFKTSFRETQDGKYLTAGPCDWVEVSFWSCYSLPAGTEMTKSGPASCIVEMQILGDEKDPALYLSEQEKIESRRRMARLVYEKKLDRISPDLKYAIDSMSSLKAAIEDLGASNPGKYDSAKYLGQFEQFKNVFNVDPENKDQVEKALAAAPDFLKFRREALMANPLLSFDRLLVRTGDSDLQANWMSNCSRGKHPRNGMLQILRLSDPDAELVPAVKPLNGSFIGDICLHWDANRMLVTCLSEKNTWEIYETSLDKPEEFRQISPTIGPDVDNVEGCYLPDGGFLFVSSASMMGVPCIGGSGLVGNIFRVEKDLKTVRQVTFEQDQDWNPIVLPNGRVLYLRWEYVDTPHYFSRLLMHMNPDGSNQIEYYGSNSYWPNCMFYTRPIPNSTKFCTIVSGHHGTARAGELHIFDPTKGRHETEGHVQQIPSGGQKFVMKTMDPLVDNSWPKFLFPAPLSEKYFLVSAKMSPSSPWGLYLVDVFDNMLLIKEGGIFEATPLIERPVPPVVASRLMEGEKDSTVFLTDVYFGPGMKNVPRGTVKKLRIFGYQYGYRGIGGHHMMGIESSWDAKILLGEVPVYEDGSASFRIPANTPLAVQPLGEDGSAMQLMRSWLVGMPGEGVTCAGCHESQNSATPAKRTIAMTKAPVEITPFHGEARPMGFRREVQPVLDKYCVGCHDGKEGGRPDFSDPNIPQGGRFGKSYQALRPYVRTPGPESDYHLQNPMEYNVNTSFLFQHLRDGRHHNVRPDAEAMKSLALWVDMNAPYHATWTEVASAFNQSVENVSKMAARTRELRSLYAGIDEDPEHGANAQVERPAFVKPEPCEAPNTKAPENTAAQVNVLANPKRETIDLGNGVKLDLVEIPSGQFVIGDDFGDKFEANRNVVTIEKPFLMATTEVTNEMYALFDPSHDSGVIDAQDKDQSARGFYHNFPLQPVIRVSWEDAQNFCKWLSEKTGRKFRLPTEAEWEWAAKAGTDQPFWWGGDLNGDFTRFANLADDEMRLLGRKAHGRNDHEFIPALTWNDAWRMFRKDNAMEKNRLNLAPIDCIIPVEGVPNGEGTARYEASPWGLFDVIGNVAEWTQSDFRPYPYNAADGRNDGKPGAEKVVRGGSWYDPPASARAGYRTPYYSWQKVFNVGFRVVCEE